jgi:hypothetical protein
MAADGARTDKKNVSASVRFSGGSEGIACVRVTLAARRHLQRARFKITDEKILRFENRPTKTHNLQNLK